MQILKLKKRVVKMKKLLVTLLVLSLCLTGGMLQGFAVAMPPLYGDVNQSYSVNITDATIIQKALAGQITLDYLDSLLADYNHDGEITIADVTDIQKKIAGVKLSSNCGGILDIYISITDFYADYLSGSVSKGKSVTFTAKAVGSANITYEFEMNGTVVQPRSESNTFTYVFEEAGSYYLYVYAYNESGYYKTSSMSFYVREEIPDDEVRLIRTKLTTERLKSEIIGYSATAQAEGGEGPYCYDFILRPDSGYGETGLSEKDIEAFNQYIKNNETDWQIRYDEHNFAYYYRAFTENNSVYIDRNMWSIFPDINFELLIQAKDSNESLSSTERMLVLRQGY